jgi:hypothetical protein
LPHPDAAGVVLCTPGHESAKSIHKKTIIPDDMEILVSGRLANRGGARRSSLSEIATWIAAWQMPRPFCSCILALVTNTGGAELFSPALWEECANGVGEKANGPVDGIGEV